jgi:Bacterial Ig-like domain (group 2)
MTSNWYRSRFSPPPKLLAAANIPLSVDAGAQVQLRALGDYIHPPVTKDITNQVKWSSNTPQMVTVNATGLITVTGLACGGTIISATVTTNSSAGNISSAGAIVTGSMTANVVCPTSIGSGGGQVLTVMFQGAGSGSVTSTPVGISCTTTCSAAFPTGTLVTLQAMPNGSSTFGGWVSCDPGSSGQTCNVTLNSARTVTVTFN